MCLLSTGSQVRILLVRPTFNAMKLSIIIAGTLTVLLGIVLGSIIFVELPAYEFTGLLVGLWFFAVGWGMAGYAAIEM